MEDLPNARTVGKVPGHFPSLLSQSVGHGLALFRKQEQQQQNVCSLLITSWNKVDTKTFVATASITTDHEVNHQATSKWLRSTEYFKFADLSHEIKPAVVTIVFLSIFVIGVFYFSTLHGVVARKQSHSIMHETGVM